MKDIIKEINDRKIVNSLDDNSKIIGIEVKRRRLALSKTLETISAKICSISYLSKVENNNIKTNKNCLAEICEKVDLTEEQINLLMNFKETLKEILKAYLNNNISFIDSIINSGQGFENYRYQIIKFVYYLSHKNIEEANNLYSTIIKLTSTMSDFDLYIFSLFGSILFYYNKLYKECFDILRFLDAATITNEFEILKNKYLFFSLYQMNKVDIRYSYDVLSKLLLDVSRYELLDEINYFYAIYLIKNNSEFEFNHFINKITDKNRIDCLKFINDFVSNDLHLSDYTTSSFTPYLKTLYYAIVKNQEYENLYSQLSTNIDALNEFSLEILEYLFESNKKVEYINVVGIPASIRSNDQFSIRYFLDQYTLLKSEDIKYKAFFVDYSKARDIK